MKHIASRLQLFIHQRIGQPYSLRRRVMSSAGLFITVVLVFFSLQIAFFINRTEQFAWHAHQGGAANTAAQSVHHLMERTEDVLILASSLAVEGHLPWSQAMHALFQMDPDILEAIQFDADGQFQATGSNPGPQLLPNLPSLQHSAWYQTARAGQPYYSGRLIAPSGESYLVIAVPDAGGGVLAVRLDLHALEHIIQEIHSGAGGQVYLVDGQGQIIVFAGQGELLATSGLQGRLEFASALRVPQKQWFGEYTNFTGLPVVGATAAVPDTEWVVFAEMPQKEAYLASRLAWLLLGGGMLIFSVLTTWLAARYLERLVFHPMERLRDGAEHVGQGDLSFRVRMDRRDEIGLVAQTFDRMAEQLDLRQQQLMATAESLNTEIAERRRAQEIQKVSEERYRAIVEDQTELICRFTPDGTLTFVNEAYCRYFGQPRETLLGSSFMPLIPAEDQAIVQQQVATLSLQNPVVTYLHRVIMTDGQVRWQEWTDRALFDEAGCLVEFASVGRDLTSRKLAEEELARRVEQMDALYATSLEINAQQELPRLLRAIMQRAVELVGTSMGGLYLVRPEGEDLELVVGLNLPGEYEGTILSPGEGVSGIVAETGEPMSVEDYQAWPGKAPVYDKVPFGRVLGVPLKRGDQVIGVITLTDREFEGKFSPEDVRLASLFADQAVIAIERTRLYEQLQEELAMRSRIAEELHHLNLELEDRVRARTRELAASNTALHHRVEIEQFTAAISTRFVNLGLAEIQPAIQSTLGLLGGFAGADRCTIFQFSPDGQRMNNSHEWCSQGIESRIGNRQDMPVTGLAWGQEQLEAYRMIYIPSLADLPPQAEPENKLLRDHGIRTLVAIPLVHGKGLLGYLSLETVRAEKSWAEEDRALMQVIAQIIASALDRQRTEEILQSTFKALQSSEDEMRALFAAMTDVVIVYDQHGVYRKIAPTNPALLYLPDDEMLGKTLHQVLPPSQADLLLEGILRALETQRPVDIDYCLPINGQDVWFAGMISPAADNLVMLVARDITERKRIQEQLEYDAFHDAMTGLPNRALFMDRLGRAVERAHRRPLDASAVLFLDLDRFKVVNDSLGHAAGDHLLVSFARRLETLLRSSDTAARLGGDEFVILLEELKGSSDAIHVAQRIREELKTPFQIGAHRASTTASIGIVLNMDSYTRPEDVLRDADIAMFRAKALGKDRYEIFNASLRKHAITRMELEGELRGALERGEFHLLYQPIYALETGQVIGFEALLRWHSPHRGRVEPAEFIPAAEETGLIIPIGEWVLGEACRQIRRWQMDFPQDPSLAINVNLSGRQFDHPRLVEQVRATLAASGLTPACLRLELSESVFMERLDGAPEILTNLLELGVQFQIDDFGTGFSSLASLQRFPIRTIKIDRGFIQHIASGGGSSVNEIVRTILTLAQGLGIDSIAEGIETGQQLEQLIGLNCPYGQGFYLGVPLEPWEVEKLLERNPPLDTFR